MLKRSSGGQDFLNQLDNMKLDKLNNWIFVMVMFIAFSCSPWSSETDRALKLAGDNREELEKVLLHYSENEADSLKLKAAEFLISNMIFQYTKFGPGVDSLNVVYQEVFGYSNSDRRMIFESDSMKKRTRYEVRNEYDLRRVSAEYLIKQIELAFETYNRFSWAKDYPFQTFCEFILPYKIEHADTLSWRQYVLREYDYRLNYSELNNPGERMECEKFSLCDSLIKEKTNASDGRVIKLLPDYNFEMDISVNSWGMYKILVSYFNGGREPIMMKVLINGKIVDNLICRSTGRGWDDNLNSSILEVIVDLDSGKNSVGLLLDKKYLYADYISIVNRVKSDMLFPGIDKGEYFLTNKVGLVGLDQDSLVNRAGLKIYTDTSKAWPAYINPWGLGNYQLTFNQDSSIFKVLDAFSEPTSNWVLVFSNYGTKNQNWTFLPYKDGFQIRNQLTDKILAYSALDSCLIQLPLDSMSDNYIWKFHKISRETSLDSIVHISTKVAQRLTSHTNLFNWHDIGTSLGQIDPLSIYKYKYGTCGEETQFQTILLRSLGVASAIDFVMSWGDRGPGHSWSVIFDLDGNTIQNNCHHPVGARTKASDFKKGKVYRNTNSINYESVFIKNSGREPIPSDFLNPYFIDVTDEYCQIASPAIQIEYSDKDEHRFGFLMVANYEKDWVVTGFGDVGKDSKSIQFENVETYVTYLPVFYKTQTDYSAFNDPFFIDSLGEVNYLTANFDLKRSIIIKRKYPNRVVTSWHHKRILGGVFQAANRSDFSDAVTIGVIDSSMLEPIYQNISVNNQCEFKYLRYKGPSGGYCNMSEILFLNAKGDTLSGEWSGTSGRGDKTYQKVYDGDVLSYFDAESADEGWVCLKLDKPSSVNRIRFAARNDGNMVEVGNEYELVYWDQEWRSLGKRIASTDSLIYENVPSGALYLLHNHTKGKEERIFTIDEKGNQVWW